MMLIHICMHCILNSQKYDVNQEESNNLYWFLQTSKLREKSKAVSSSSEGSGDNDAPRDALNTVNYTSTGATASNLPKDMGATRTFEFDTEFNKDAQAIFERSAQVNKVWRE